MGFKESFDSLKMEFSADVEKATQKLSSFEALGADHEAELKALEDSKSVELKEAHEQGFEEGLKQAGQAGGSDKIYSDAELNASIEKAVEIAEEKKDAEIKTLTDKNADLESRLSDLEAKAVDTEAAVKAATESIRSEMKAEFVRDIKAVDVDNQAMLKKYEEVAQPSKPVEESTSPVQGE